MRIKLKPYRNRGLTLLEISLVIFILIAMMSASLHVAGGMGEWRLGKDASETLRSVYVAQRTYLADHPHETVSSLTNAKLLPYLPNQVTSFPTIKGVNDEVLTINVATMPANINDGSGGVYDLSDSSEDSLWDVGKF